MRQNDYVIIMAGGIGSRFWPMSRTSYPKQFHDILGTGKSLIQMTYDRFLDFIPAENIFVVTNKRYKGLVNEQLPAMSDNQILLEPMGRNTAPCIAYACFKIREINPEAAFMVAASDHLIMNEAKFRHDIELGLDAVREQEIIMTLGIPPTRPDTGYGYIQYIEDEEQQQHYYKVKVFTEKPDKEVAKSFLASGDFLWNSGMFLFSLPTILASFKTHMSDTYDLFDGIRTAYNTDSENDEIADVYSRCKNESFDYGIMEHTEEAYVIKATFDWSDLGTWRSLYENMEKDYLKNATKNKVMILESSGNIIRTVHKDKLIVLDGLEDFIVVDTDDVLLICKMEDEQVIKQIVAEVKNNDEGYA